MFDFPTVPELAVQSTEGLTQELLQLAIENWTQAPSVFGSLNSFTSGLYTRGCCLSQYWRISRFGIHA